MSSRSSKKRADKLHAAQRQIEAQGLAALLVFGCDCGGDHITVGGRKFVAGEALSWAQLHTAHALARLRVAVRPTPRPPLPPKPAVMLETKLTGRKVKIDRGTESTLLAGQRALARGFGGEP